MKESQANIMELLNFPVAQFKVFLLILIRVSMVLFLLPIFRSPVIPVLVKTGFAMILSMLFLQVVTVDLNRFPVGLLDGAILAVSELMMGLILGLSVRLFFSAIQFAGQMVGFQMGFAILNVLDPQSGMQVSIIDQISYWVALLIFLVLNGHHMLISAIGESFELVALGGLTLQSDLFSHIISMAGNLFSLAIKIGAPAIIALLFTSTAFGICAKFAPQMNILIAAFPVKIIVGLTFFSLSLQIVANVVRSYLSSLPRTMSILLSWMGGY